MANLFVGDVHTDTEYVLNAIKNTIPLVDEPIDSIVFLGDYTDEWAATNESIIGGVERLIEFKNECVIPTVFLIGNHDFAYLNNAPGPGTHIEIIDEVKDLLLQLEPKMAHAVNNMLCSHAGFTLDYLNEIFNDKVEAPRDANLIANRVNAIYEDSSESVRCRKFNVAGHGRGGYSFTPSCIWADLGRELLRRPAHGITQIVGHTPVYTPIEVMFTEPKFKKATIYACDIFTKSTNGTRGNDEYPPQEHVLFIKENQITNAKTVLN